MSFNDQSGTPSDASSHRSFTPLCKNLIPVYFTYCPQVQSAGQCGAWVLTHMVAQVRTPERTDILSDSTQVKIQAEASSLQHEDIP